MPEQVVVVTAPTAAGSATPAPAAPTPAASEKSFLVWTADRTGVRLQPLKEDGTRPKQDPSRPEARQITFTPNDAGKQPPPSDQMDLASDVNRVIHALNHLYPPGDPTSEANFRFFYRSVFGVAQLALEKEKGFDAKTAQTQLDIIKKDIVDDEGPRVKSANIKMQLKWAAWIAIPFGAAYLLLSHVPDNGYIGRWLGELGAKRAAVANFMLLWVGCFLGVCLSYALRTTKLTIEDLVNPESDYLTPAIRLLLTGTLTMLLVMLSMLDIVDVSIASHKLSSIANPDSQMLAFVLGVIFGIGEKLLPATIMAKTKDLVGSIK
jgi:hypothetical protein